ncbi:MAG: tetratricopeptide repeat protein [Anaerolineae bacterium]
MVNLAEARRWYEKGIDAYRVGEYEEALEALQAARNLFVEVQDPTGEIEALGSMGVVQIQLEEWDEAQRLLHEALELCLASGDRSNQGKVLGNLGMLYTRQGDDHKAAEAYEQAIAIFRDLGERNNEEAVARQLKKLRLKEVLGDVPEVEEEESAPGGAQRLVRRLFRLLGRVTGHTPVKEDEEALE